MKSLFIALLILGSLSAHADSACRVENLLGTWTNGGGYNAEVNITWSQDSAGKFSFVRSFTRFGFAGAETLRDHASPQVDGQSCIVLNKWIKSTRERSGIERPVDRSNAEYSVRKIVYLDSETLGLAPCLGLGCLQFEASEITIYYRVK